MLARWEKIFDLRPRPDATDNERRAAMLERWARFSGIANHAKLLDHLQSALGSYFVAIEYIDLSLARITVPDASYPWGTPNTDYPWSSTVAKILVRLQKPAGATEGDFYAEAGKVGPIVDAIAPAWVAYDWYREPAAPYAAINIGGGPSAAGFYLDADHNLDNSVFDV
jgi:hypothetical protein